MNERKTYAPGRNMRTQTKPSLLSKLFLPLKLRLQEYGYPLLKAHKHSWSTCFARLRSTPLSTLMTIAVIAISLALPIGFYIAVDHIKAMGQRWDKGLQLTLYLAEDTTIKQRQELVQKIQAREDIAGVTYISPDDGLMLLQTRGGFGDLTEQLPKNPLPDVLEIYPSVSIKDPKQIRQILDELANLPNVAIAQYDRQWTQRLFALLKLGERITATLAFLLSCAVLLCIGNTIRLMLHKYYDEIQVLSLLGASRAFTRRPFLYVGFVYGLLGGFLAWLLIAGSLIWLNKPLHEIAMLYGNNYNFTGVGLRLLPSLLLMGALFGLTGARLTVNRQLQHLAPK